MERRIERQRAKRQWEAHRYSGFSCCMADTLGALLEPQLILNCSHRREILFDYEQYEYHGTSVSRFLKVNCRPSKLSGNLHMGDVNTLHV